jgi:nucleotide-binding universal stress UspA family protein
MTSREGTGGDLPTTDTTAAAESRFRILFCVDGSEESYRGLRYAARLGGGVDADIVLLYVRPVDQGMRSGGLQVRVARENMLNWGLELPGIMHLKRGRDMLMQLAGSEVGWAEEHVHREVEGDPLGDNAIVYRNKSGKMIALKLKVASDIATGILDQWELGNYNLIVLGASANWAPMPLSLWDPAVAEKIALYAPCSVLVARELEEGNGHLICTDGSEHSLKAVEIDAEIAARCKCPISLISVALDDEGLPAAKESVERARDVVESRGFKVDATYTPVGNPVEQIIEHGQKHSLIVMSDTGKSAIQRFFMGSVAFKVLEKARNSVMIVRDASEPA